MSLLDKPVDHSSARRWFGVGCLVKCTGPGNAAKGLFIVVADGVLDNDMDMYSYECDRVEFVEPGRYVTTKGRRIYSCFLDHTVARVDGYSPM